MRCCLFPKGQHARKCSKQGNERQERRVWSSKAWALVHCSILSAVDWAFFPAALSFRSDGSTISLLVWSFLPLCWVLVFWLDPVWRLLCLPEEFSGAAWCFRQQPGFWDQRQTLWILDSLCA